MERDLQKLAEEKLRKIIREDIDIHDGLTNYLIQNKFIAPVKPPRVKRFLDSCIITEEGIWLIECKNKERSGLQGNDIYQTFSYLKLLLEITNLAKATIVYNGFIAKKLIKHIEMYEASSYDITTQEIQNFINDYFSEERGYPYLIVPNTQGIGIRSSKNGKYSFDIKYREFLGDIIISSVNNWGDSNGVVE